MFFLRSGNSFVRFLIVFIAGIAAGVMTGLKVNGLLLFSAIVVYLCFYWYEKKNKTDSATKSLVAWILLFICGSLLVEVRTEKNTQNHFSHFKDSMEYYQARVITAPEYREKTVRIVLEVAMIKANSSGWFSSSGKLLGYIPKEKVQGIRKGDVLLIRGKPSSPPPPANPGQFDYVTYLSRQNIYAVHFLRAHNYIKIEHTEEWWLIQLADNFRNFCEEKLRAGIKNDNEYFLTVALLLGVKTGLDEKLYQAYSETGTVHALAVSGLHVSLIYFIVVLVFGFLKRIKHGKFLFALLSIMIFWFYALVTGFSPSVVRAVTMFSVFLLGGILKRNSGIYNVLAFSAFIILCIEPYWLMDIGFQFSFLAVVGIAWLYPFMYGWLECKNFLADKLWEMVCLSFAAQLAVAPLSIYYFHSFPLLFLPFNMLIVPLSSLALYTGLTALIVYKIKFLSHLCMMITEYIVRFMNYLVQIPSGSDFLKVDFLSLTIEEVILVYLFIIFLFFSLKNKMYKSFVYAFACLFLFVFSILYNSISSFQKNIFTLYSVRGETVFSFIHKGSALVVSDSILAKNDKIFRYNLYNHLANEKIFTLTFTSLENDSLLTKKNYYYGQLIIWQGISIFRINKDYQGELPDALLKNIHYLIVSDADFYKRLIKSKKGIGAETTVIIDPSVKERSWQERKDFYYISRRGAFVKEEGIKE